MLIACKRISRCRSAVIFFWCGSTSNVVNALISSTTPPGFENFQTRLLACRQLLEYSQDLFSPYLVARVFPFVCLQRLEQRHGRQGLDLRHTALLPQLLGKLLELFFANHVVAPVVVVEVSADCLKCLFDLFLCHIAPLNLLKKTPVTVNINSDLSF